LNQGSCEIDGSIGQKGRELASMYAVQAMAPHSSTWHQPSAARGLDTLRPIAEPAALPTPRPTRNAARIRENVYVLPPKSSESRRVHTTSAASAVIPDSAMVM
jgi:hypothetical protein